MSEEPMNEEILKLKREALKKNELIVIKFTADWCGPCKLIKEICKQFEKTKPSLMKKSLKAATETPCLIFLSSTRC